MRVCSIAIAVHLRRRTGRGWVSTLRRSECGSRGQRGRSLLGLSTWRGSGQEARCWWAVSSTCTCTSWVQSIIIITIIITTAVTFLVQAATMSGTGAGVGSGRAREAGLPAPVLPGRGKCLSGAARTPSCGSGQLMSRSEV